MYRVHNFILVSDKIFKVVVQSLCTSKNKNTPTIPCLLLQVQVFANQEKREKEIKSVIYQDVREMRG